MSENKGTTTVEDYLVNNEHDLNETLEVVIQVMSDEIGELAGALAKAQSEMTMVEAKSTNPFFNSKYASLASVLETSLPPLNKNGIAVIQGSRYCTVTNGFYVTSQLIHSSGQWIKSEIRMPIGKKDAHGIGAAVTYGRRYLLSAMTGVAQADDDGNGALSKAPNNR